MVVTAIDRLGRSVAEVTRAIAEPSQRLIRGLVLVRTRIQLSRVRGLRRDGGGTSLSRRPANVAVSSFVVMFTMLAGLSTGTAAMASARVAKPRPIGHRALV